MSYEQVEDLYPLSPMQQGMLFSSLLAPQSGVYVEQRLCSLHGALNLSAFERAWQQVVDRHPVMRTSFVWEGVDEPVQVVHTRAALPLEQQDWRGIERLQQKSQLEEFLKADRGRGFDLLAAPLARLTLLRLDKDSYQFIWTYHHLLMDGWSGPLLVKEVFAFYGAFCRNEYLSLPIPRPYRDYIAWIQRQDASEAERFWRETLKGFHAPIELNLKRPTVELPPEETTSGTLRVRFTSKRTVSILATLREHKLTLNTLIQGAWALLLSRYSGARDIVFGAVVSGRPPELPGVEQMVGLFINTLPVRVQVSPRATALSYLKNIQARQFELQSYEYSSLVQVQGWSDVPRGMPLYESLLVFENYPFDVPEEEQRETVSTPVSGDSLEARSFRFEEEVNYPLSLTIIPGGELAFRLIYDRRRFDDDAIRRMMGHLEHLLEEVVREPEQRVSELSLLSRAEERQLVYEWNETGHAQPEQQCLHELVMAQARKTPAAIAVINSAGEQFSYRELDERSNQLGRYLRRLGVGPEVRVGLCLQRSERLVLGVLGILKAGGGYVALDAQYPLARLEQMLEDAGVAVVVTEEALLEELPAHWARVVSVDGEWSEIERQSRAALESGVSGENLAYVIYTSGSTGRPKGVLLPHRGLPNLRAAQAQLFNPGPADRVLQFSSLSFDASVFEIVMALASGATLCFARRDVLIAGQELVRFMRDSGITNVTLPPSVLAVMPAAELPELRTMVLAGEALTADLVERWARGRDFFNAYGPTEATIWSSASRCVNGNDKPAIGRPIFNTRIYLLDEHKKPVPVGMTGELFISGIGLARGYLNLPDTTAEKFIPDPFSVEPGQRMYNSGDLARYLPDGNIMFVGRADDQVKVRGFRIETGEIEATLKEFNEVSDAVVVVRKSASGDQTLVAYVVPAPNHHPEERELRNFLKQRLPEYMLPATFLTLEALPLMPSGKVDRKALLAPENFAQSAADKYVAPRTPLEEVLARIWGQVLGVERVGVNDDFFQLGGHSLLATQIISQVREALHTEVQLRTLFDSPTVGGLAEAIAQSQVEASDREMELMLTELESLSEDDVRTWLEIESTQGEKS